MFRFRKLLNSLLVAALLLVMVAPVAGAQSEASGDIVDIAVGDPNFSTLVTAVQAAGLVDALKAEGPFTVFAPTNAAFEAIDPATLDALLADPAGDLTQILLYHVVPSRVLAADVTDGLTAETLQGGTLTFAVTDSGVTVNGANIIATDIEGTNGVIHVIDAVLLPPAAEEAPAEEAPTEAAAAEEAPLADIVDTAVSAGSFTTLVTAVQAAGLVDALKADGPFTVFAPTDDAFAKLDAATLDTLLADPGGDLTDILLYHVVSGKVMAADLSEGLTATTLQGSDLTFSLADGAKVNGVNIVTTDIETSNGVIHVIDAVLLPQAPEAMPAAEATAPADAAPEAMPTTGGSPVSGTLLSIVAAALVVVLLGVVAVVQVRKA